MYRSPKTQIRNYSDRDFALYTTFRMWRGFIFFIDVSVYRRAIRCNNDHGYRLITFEVKTSFDCRPHVAAVKICCMLGAFAYCQAQLDVMRIRRLFISADQLSIVKRCLWRLVVPARGRQIIDWIQCAQC